MFKPTIAKKVGLLLLLPAGGAFFALVAFYLYLAQTAGHGHFINVAGRQRMLSQQFIVYADMVATNGGGRDHLRNTVASFEESLHALEQGGQVMGQYLPPAPSEVLDEISEVKRQWAGIKESLLLISDLPAESPQAQQAHGFVQSKIDLLTKVSDRVVTAFDSRRQAVRRRMFYTLTAIAGADLVFLFVGLWLTRRFITRPILTIEKAVRHFQTGGFPDRVPIVTGDELATLGRAFNEMSDSRARAEADRKRAEEARARLAAVLETTIDFVSFSDVDGHILYMNKAGRRMVGIGEDEDISNLAIGSWLAKWGRETVLNEGIPAAMRDGVWSGETALLSRDGREIPVSQVVIAHKAPDGTIEFLSTIARDLTERKRFEERLVYLADHDALTGLHNRRRFQQELSRQINYALRHGLGGAVLFLDLDNFKLVNDTLGHRAGDELLTTLAGRLRQQLQETDTLARLGGDEFAILLPEAEAGRAQAVAEQILHTVEHNGFVVEGQPIRITASIGIALFPEHGKKAEDLLTHADLAMYRAKDYGRNRFCMHSPDEDQHAKMQSNLNWLVRIREALEHDRFVLHLQPILDLREGRVSQYEVLLRMLGDTGEIIMPGAFLDVAERFGLIHGIDRWVVRRAIQIVAEHRQAGRDLCLEVNLSGKAFTDPELLPMIRRELDATSVDPGNLVFEITETAACDNIGEAQHFIVALKAVGCRFALDDFGVGFSSFSYLKHLPVDYLKLDGGFIRNLPRDPVDQHLVKAMAEVARGLGKKTIAEFVENEETVRLLREYGVDFAQGYHIGRPGPASEVLGGGGSRTCIRNAIS